MLALPASDISPKASRTLTPPDKGQLAEAVREVHTIAYHKHVGTLECPHIRSNVGRAGNWLVQQHAGQHPRRAAGHDQVLGKGEGAARLQNVIDQQHIAAAHIGFDVAQDFDAAGLERVPAR